jgi:hypothetical protein
MDIDHDHGPQRDPRLLQLAKRRRHEQLTASIGLYCSLKVWSVSAPFGFGQSPCPPAAARARAPAKSHCLEAFGCELRVWMLAAGVDVGAL